VVGGGEVPAADLPACLPRRWCARGLDLGGAFSLVSVGRFIALRRPMKRKFSASSLFSKTQASMREFTSFGVDFDLPIQQQTLGADLYYLKKNESKTNLSLHLTRLHLAPPAPPPHTFTPRVHHPTPPLPPHPPAPMRRPPFRLPRSSLSRRTLTRTSSLPPATPCRCPCSPPHSPPIAIRCGVCRSI
jgi:hypothetical protein